MGQPKKKINVEEDDFGLLVNCAIRYCVGRRTYMPGLICNYVKLLLPFLSEQSLCCMERDIRDAGSYGDPCDLQTWMDMLSCVRCVMRERHIKPYL